MKIENMLQRLSCISFLFKPPWITQTPFNNRCYGGETTTTDFTMEI